MNAIDTLLDRIKHTQESNDNLVTDVRRFLLDNLYKQDLFRKSTKSNALNKQKTTYSDLNTRDEDSFYKQQLKHMDLIEFYISKTNDFLLSKNLIYAYLLDEQSIKVKTLGLRLLNVYLHSSTNKIFKCDYEFHENIVPIIEQFFFYIPPHFNVHISYSLIKELFSTFTHAISYEKDFKKKQDLILIVYSENVISTMIPALLLSKTDNIVILNFILEKLKTEYINNNSRYFVNVRRFLNAFKPLKMYPEYLKSMNRETIKHIYDIIKVLPLYDTTHDVYKYDLIIFYVIFYKHESLEVVSKSDMEEFMSNLKNVYSDVQQDMSKILEKI
ncbi:uncharacterized protein HGUI_02000 [Hanseniaspora guilliermondii]|uniref:Uncharacterized protein n=1 Tax=Hanseniaspora guilliermondii TaxID=56406 RepID=A0A1L0B075_9ASCO|nr:uncharacterized protein HGUI_02000 [Hanseniaspora guilliermondii]